MKKCYVAYDKNNNIIGQSDDGKWLKEILGNNVKIVRDKDYENCM